MKQIKLYSQEEINELKQWFAGRELPKSLRLDESMYIPDLQTALEGLFAEADVCIEKPQMQGYAIVLDRIRKKLEE